jgi:hypothetical protein
MRRTSSSDEMLYRRGPRFDVRQNAANRMRRGSRDEIFTWGQELRRRRAEWVAVRSIFGRSDLLFLHFCMRSTNSGGGMLGGGRIDFGARGRVCMKHQAGLGESAGAVHLSLICC